MSTRLVILGLLRDRPLYGYEIKQIIEEQMTDWTSIAFGSIYFALDKMTKESFVSKVGMEQAGSRPARAVYEITDTGRDEFKRLLRQTWNEFDREYFPLDIGIFFMDSLPHEEVSAALHKRISILEASLQQLDGHQTEELADPQVPARARAIFDHTRLHLQAELEWLRGLIRHVDAGEY
jgi:DNA-binding PadR family transcriptional regulator